MLRGILPVCGWWIDGWEWKREGDPKSFYLCSRPLQRSVELESLNIHVCLPRVTARATYKHRPRAVDPARKEQPPRLFIKISTAPTAALPVGIRYQFRTNISILLPIAVVSSTHCTYSNKPRACPSMIKPHVPQTRPNPYAQ